MLSEVLFLRKKIELTMAVIVLIAALLAGKSLTKYVSAEVRNNESIVVVVDPGHGDQDPGKIGVNKTLEKDLNLCIALKLKKQLEKNNITVQMTRKDDISLGKNKIEDMKARIKNINEIKPKLVVSIHQNSYHESSINGAQVFYYTHSPEGKKAALIMQNSLLSFHPQNTRQAKANDTYYLLKKTEVPTIIVECGFLSNSEEERKLTDESYQNQVVDAICHGIISYINEK